MEVTVTASTHFNDLLLVLVKVVLAQATKEEGELRLNDARYLVLLPLTAAARCCCGPLQCVDDIDGVEVEMLRRLADSVA